MYAGFEMYYTTVTRRVNAFFVWMRGFSCGTDEDMLYCSAGFPVNRPNAIHCTQCGALVTFGFC